MRAYPDARCVFGYMTICEDCLKNTPPHVDTSKPLQNPPAKGKKQPCEMCKKRLILE